MPFSGQEPDNFRAVACDFSDCGLTISGLWPVVFQTAACFSVQDPERSRAGNAGHPRLQPVFLIRINDGDLPALAAGHESVRLIRPLERELVRNQIAGMDAPSHKAVYQIHHLPCGSNP